MAFDDRILAEYDDVLSRPRLGIDRDRAQAILSYLRAQGEAVAAAPLPAGIADSMPDPDDQPFVEVALSSAARALVTGNATHYRTLTDLSILSPSAFLRLCGPDKPARPDGSSETRQV